MDRFDRPGVFGRSDVARQYLARLAIAAGYLGAEDGYRYVKQRTKPGVVVRLPLASARTWDFRAILPTADR